MIGDGAMNIVGECAPVVKKISVVVPVFNEEENLRELHQELRPVLESLAPRIESEIIYVDDGSQDGSFEILKELYVEDSRVKVVRFRKNYGQTAAMAAGFDLASGDVIITMDADRQNDPSDIPRLIEKVNKGHDVVSGWRKNRKDPFLNRRLPSIMANGLISFITRVHLHDYGCTLKAYRSEIVKNIHLYGEMHRFIPAIASWLGVSIAEVPVNHRPRVAGQSKYGISRTIRVILDLITVKFLLSFSTRPIQFFGVLGVLSGGVGFLIGLYLTILKYVYSQSIGGRPLLMLAVLLIFIGVQFISMGLLGELMARTYHETQGKPIYWIREICSRDGNTGDVPRQNKKKKES
jgi:glycosyltransferase involved in cell wall biosynthesis